ncbi:MAG TPA: heterodisulfide reductase-related iron-sulfur binding cluster, partial [Chthonomonadales bacterium]|nr:heterodisulfide reductase-related iron-sulfur binding cluster [Chthonomonadales bacterium]
MAIPTRTIFLHIDPVQQGVFYLLAFIALTICFAGIYRRIRLWRQGQGMEPPLGRSRRAWTLLAEILGQRRTLRRFYAGRMHKLIFYGFVVLFIGTCIVAVEHYGAYVFGSHWLYKGTFYLICKVTLDLFGAFLLVGIVMALARRLTARPASVGNSAGDIAFLLLLLVATLTGFLLEGAGISADPLRVPYAGYSPVGELFARPLGHISALKYELAWWIHVPLVLSVIAVLPYGRWLHLFVAPASIALSPNRPMGALPTISMQEVEKTGKVGLAEVTDLNQWQRLSLDACMECGRCTDACPANAVGKELNPKGIVLDLRKLMGQSHDTARNVSTDIISDESLWACTNCHACVRECPVYIRHVDIIDGIRRYRVAEGRLAGPAATMLRQLGSRENPWGLPAAQRMDWAKGMEIAQATLDDGREVLLWVGCASAFEPRAQRSVRALAELLRKSGVKFSVLGARERCTGDPARRAGDEFLFQQLAEANIQTLNEVGAETIVTDCPHCMNTLKNEYPQFNGNYKVLHHTELLSKLITEGRLTLPPQAAAAVTYHDPCFLARVNGVTEAPRSLLKAAAGAEIREVPRRESRTFCCGAGGARMWMEEPPNQRPGNNRAQELLATGAASIAVSCPFCKVMLSDSAAAAADQNGAAVADVAELVLEAVEQKSG